jgi:hypothetical protein
MKRNDFRRMLDREHRAHCPDDKTCAVSSRLCKVPSSLLKQVLALPQEQRDALMWHLAQDKFDRLVARQPERYEVIAGKKPFSIH